VGIICLTPENLTKPWILFEAGAISKTVDESSVCPYLIGGLTWPEVPRPLSNFQANEATPKGTLALVNTVNSALSKVDPDNALGEKDLIDTFEKWYPDLEIKLNTMPSVDEPKAPQLESREILEEIVETVRGLARGQKALPENLFKKALEGKLDPSLWATAGMLSLTPMGQRMSLADLEKLNEQLKQFLPMKGHQFLHTKNAYGYEDLWECQICGQIQAGDGNRRFALDINYDRLPERESTQRLLAACPGPKST